jgi:hypothetical protein
MPPPNDFDAGTLRESLIHDVSLAPGHGRKKPTAPRQWAGFAFRNWS